MKEVKNPKKPLAYYYAITLIALLLFNIFIAPLLNRQRIVETDYSTFMRMIDERQIGKVDVSDTEIVFTDKNDGTIYVTGVMYDPMLTQRLYDCGAEFAKDIEQAMSPVLSYLLTLILPLVIFFLLGQFMRKKLMDQMGGKDVMSFGMGKSNAKIYVQSTQGIRFSDVAGEDEAKESLAEIVDYLHNPGKYTDAGASMPKGILLVGPPGTGKTMLS